MELVAQCNIRVSKVGFMVNLYSIQLIFGRLETCTEVHIFVVTNRETYYVTCFSDARVSRKFCFRAYHRILIDNYYDIA